MPAHGRHLPYGQYAAGSQGVRFCRAIPTPWYSQSWTYPRRDLWRGGHLLSHGKYRRNLHADDRNGRSGRQYRRHLDVPGIDAVYIGPGDLGMSVGLPPKIDREELEILRFYETVLAGAKNKVYTRPSQFSCALRGENDANGLPFVGAWMTQAFCYELQRAMCKWLKSARSDFEEPGIK